MTTIGRSATTVSGLPEPGDTWNDRYEITAELGRGGFGRVYRAWDPLLERDVAIKMLRPSDDFTPTDHRRFRRETNIAASLVHRNIVTVYDGGEHGGLLYLVMRFVAGRDLRYELATGPLTEHRAVSIVRQVGTALDHAHDKGLVHRDVKPGNILCHADSDAVYLTDFGISRRVDQTTDNPVTQGLAPATLAYAAPEQMRTSARVDGRTDLYALGCVLFECLTGRKPFEGEMAEMITAHLHEAPPRVSSIRPELSRTWDRVIATAMAKDPAGRFQRCAGLTAAAEFVLPPREPPAEPVTATLPAAAAPVSADEPAARSGAGHTRRLERGATATEPALPQPVESPRPVDDASAASGSTVPPAPAGTTPAQATAPTTAGDPPTAQDTAMGHADVVSPPTGPLHRWLQRPAALAAAGLLAVVLVAWLVWPLMGSGREGGAGDAEIAGGAGPDGATALDDAQLELLNAVGVFDEADCRPPTRDPLPGKQVAVACASDDEAPTRVVFRQFATVDERDAAFASLASAAPEGECRDARRATHGYEGARGAGQVVCAVDSDNAGLSWTVPGAPIMGSARLDPAAASDLYAWWADHVGRTDG